MFFVILISLFFKLKLYNDKLFFVIIVILCLLDVWFGLVGVIFIVINFFVFLGKYLEILCLIFL